MMTNSDYLQLLFDTALEKSGIESLKPTTAIKFMQCCKKAVADNPTFAFEEHVTASQLFLNFLLSDPEMIV